MHVPQSIQTAMELKYLAAIPHHMISPSTNSPIIKPSQDNLLGLFKITGDGVVFTQVEAGHLLSGAEAFNGVLPEPAIREGKYIRWTGKQIYSVILPPISLSADPKSDKVKKVIIEYGILKQGQVDKSVSGKIVHAIHSDYGPKQVERYMNDLQIIISRYLIKSGFSVGVSDLVVHPDIVNKNREAIKKAVTDEIELAKRVHLNILDDVAGNLSEVYEGKVTTIGSALDKQVISNTVNTLDYNSNRILFMVTSGAKGSDTNIKQMMCCLGQQNIDGGRVPIGFTDRTLPHYPKYENGMESRGFIAHNFFEGLNPMEFYFHAMSGREGLIDTAVKTANSGYLQRRLVKTMEDLKTYHDYTIRDNSNEIIEFIYGNDGFDSVKIETQSTNFKLIKEEKLFKDYLFMEDEAFEDYMLAKSVTKMRESPNWFKKLESYNKAVQRCIDMIHVQMVKLLTSIDDLSLYYPVNMKKLVAKTIDLYSLDKITTKSELMPTEIIDALEQLIDDCRVNGLRNHVLEILVYDFMSPKKLIRDLHITRNAFEFMLAQVRLGFRKGRVEAGEMVGPLAAQSIGERSTQLSVLGSECITLVETYADGTSKTYSGPIGKFIDGYFDNTADTVNYVAAPNDNTNAFINISRNISVLTVDPKTEKTNWKQISQISRHPANGGMVRVTTKSQRNITTTLSHSHLKRTVDGIVPIRGDELQIGDRIPVVLKTDMPVTNTTIDIPNYGPINLDYDFGWFIGAYLSEGSLNGRHMIITNISPHFEQRVKRMATILGVQDTYVQRSKTSTIIGTKLYTNMEHQISHPAMSKFIEKEFNKGSINKQIPGFVYNTNLTFIAGLLRGYFDGDGNVTGTPQHETVRIHSVSRKLLDGVAMLLSLFGIGVSFGLEKKSEIGNYDLNTIKIFRKHIIKFYNAIGTDFQYKIDEFEKAKLTLESNSSRDYLDCLPAIGQLIADVAEPLKLPGHSRLYKRCIKEKVIGKETARKYINVFETSANSNLIDQSKLNKLKTAVNADVFWDEITNIEILPDPNELVYDIGVNGNHTFALNSGIFSHNTLNSVDWETDMLLAENGHPFEIKMGKFIDDLMDKYKDSGKIQHIPENRTEYLELETPISVPSVDDYGNMSWCQVTAVTRHLPVGDLVKITTESGREVSATQQKSFLVWSDNEKKIVQTNGADLKVGDLVPVTCQFPEPEPGQEITHLDFAKYLPKTEYLYGSDFHMAGELHDADTRTRKLGFWAQHQGKTFTIPYSRLDAFIDAWHGKKMTKTVIEKGYIYPKLTHKSHSKIPERIPLDEEFGFIIGLYLAEGWATDTFWGISNNEECIRQRVIDWCEKQSLAYTIRKTTDGTFKKGTPEEYTLKGTSTDVIIHGVFWPRFLKQWLGTGSAHKRVPAEAYVAPKAFVKGLLDGYITGDGCVSMSGTILSSSVSKELTNGIATLLMRFGIFSKLTTRAIKKPEGCRIKTENCLPTHELYIGSAMSKRFATEIGSSHPKKHDRLTNITINKNNNTKQQYRYEKDVVLDKVKTITTHQSTKTFVYDFTVPKTLNFSICNQLQCADTFHQAGVGGAGKVTQGVPRLNEMLKVTKNPKQPSNIIYMNDTDRFDRERSERVKNSIEQTKIGQILKSDPAFYLEPTNKLDNVMEEDRAFMKFYEVFAELSPAFKEIPKNPWVIRLEFDRKEMVMRNVSMDDVHKILKDMYPESSLMYSDDNAGKLVFRLRMPFETRENVEDDFKYLKNKVAEIKKIIIKGVDNIEQVYLSEPSKDCILKGKECKGFSKVGEVYEVKEEYSMSTDGANLFDLLCRDDVDATRTYSIDPNEMNAIFGIEAAKLIVEQQFRQIMTGSSAMTSPRHVSLLVDKMTHSGEFMSVDRHGISKEDIGPLAKCSFEKTPDELREAAIFGEIDKLKGVSANIMVGQIPECGTGTIKIFLDEELLQEELAKRGNLSTELQNELSEKDIFAEFQQKMCINEDDQLKINLKTIHTDGLSLSQIPDVLVD